MQLHLDNEGFVETYLVAPLGPLLLADTPDPAAALQQLKLQASAQISASLAKAGVAKTSIDALLRFVDDMPHPGRGLDITLNLLKPVSLGLLTDAIDHPAQLADLIPGGALVVGYDGP